MENIVDKFVWLSSLDDSDLRDFTCKDDSMGCDIGPNSTKYECVQYWMRGPERLEELKKLWSEFCDDENMFRR